MYCHQRWCKHESLLDCWRPQWHLFYPSLFWGRKVGLKHRALVWEPNNWTEATAGLHTRSISNIAGKVRWVFQCKQYMCLCAQTCTLCVFGAVLNTDIFLGSPIASLWVGHAASIQLSNHAVWRDCCWLVQWKLKVFILKSENKRHEVLSIKESGRKKTKLASQ